MLQLCSLPFANEMTSGSHPGLVLKLLYFSIYCNISKWCRWSRTVVLVRFYGDSFEPLRSVLSSICVFLIGRPATRGPFLLSEFLTSLRIDAGLHSLRRLPPLLYCVTAGSLSPRFPSVFPVPCRVVTVFV